MNIKINDLSHKDFFVTFLRLVNIINSHLGSKDESKMMAEMELQAFVYFLMLPFDKFKHQMFSTLARTKVLKAARDDGWELNRINLNNKLYSLIQKGFLYRDEDNIVHLDKNLMKALERIHKHKNININFDLLCGQEKQQEQ
jgi:hypothetical protein